MPGTGWVPPALGTTSQALPPVPESSAFHLIRKRNNPTQIRVLPTEQFDIQHTRPRNPSPRPVANPPTPSCSGPGTQPAPDPFSSRLKCKSPSQGRAGVVPLCHRYPPQQFRRHVHPHSIPCPSDRTAHGASRSNRSANDQRWLKRSSHLFLSRSRSRAAVRHGASPDWNRRTHHQRHPCALSTEPRSRKRSREITSIPSEGSPRLRPCLSLWPGCLPDAGG